MISAAVKFPVRYRSKILLCMQPKLIFPKRQLAHTIESKTFDLYDLQEGPSTSVELELKDALAYYKQMQLIRKMEAISSQLYMEKLIRGFLHLYSGQEACAVGIKASMEPKDTVITSYRCHGWAVVMGETVHAVLAELMGKVTGNARGKGGSMHMYYKNFYGGSGIVGSHIPLGTGVGFAHKYMNDGAVSFTVYGDGASNQGQVHESYNLAKLHNLPIVFVIENNQYGMGTSCARSSASKEYYKRGFFMPGLRLDGMDILAVREATRFAREFVVKNGPMIIELITYRYFGHSMSDPGYSYRTRDEINNWRDTRDPIKKFEKRIIESGLVKEEELKKIELDSKKEVEQAAKQARNDPDLPLKELECDCYVQYTEPVRLPGLLRFSQHKHFGFYKAASSN